MGAGCRAWLTGRRPSHDHGVRSALTSRPVPTPSVGAPSRPQPYDRRAARSPPGAQAPGPRRSRTGCRSGFPRGDFLAGRLARAPSPSTLSLRADFVAAPGGPGHSGGHPVVLLPPRPPLAGPASGTVPLAQSGHIPPLRLLHGITAAALPSVYLPTRPGHRASRTPRSGWVPRLWCTASRRPGRRRASSHPPLDGPTSGTEPPTALRRSPYRRSTSPPPPREPPAPPLTVVHTAPVPPSGPVPPSRCTAAR